MNAATLNRRPTSAIVNALKAAIVALQLPEQYLNDPNTPEAAFGNVSLFDAKDIVEAFKFLTITEQRVCVIIPMREQFKRESHNTKLILTRTLPITLLISDEVIGDRAAALWGDENTPGADGLKELVLPAVTGMLLPNPSGVTCEPTLIDVMAFENTGEKLPARITTVIELECRGGRISADVSPVT